MMPISSHAAGFFKRNAWLVGLLMWADCASNEGETAHLTCDDKLAEVEGLAAATFSELEPSAEALRELSKAYADFANDCHDHPLAAEMLFRRADVLRGLGKTHEALALYRDIHDHHGEFERRPECAFLVAFLYDVELGDRAQALKAYHNVLEIHPDSEAALWAGQALMALGEGTALDNGIELELGF